MPAARTTTPTDPSRPPASACSVSRASCSTTAASTPSASNRSPRSPAPRRRPCTTSSGPRTDWSPPTSAGVPNGGARTAWTSWTSTRRSREAVECSRSTTPSSSGTRATNAGCAFVNAWAELGGTDHPGCEVVRADKAGCATCSNGWLPTCLAPKRSALGGQLHLFYEGALVGVDRGWTHGCDRRGPGGGGAAAGLKRQPRLATPVPPNADTADIAGDGLVLPGRRDRQSLVPGASKAVRSRPGTRARPTEAAHERQAPGSNGAGGRQRTEPGRRRHGSRLRLAAAQPAP